MFLIRQVGVIMLPKDPGRSGAMDMDSLYRQIISYHGRFLKLGNDASFGLFDSIATVLSCSKGICREYTDQCIFLHYGEVFVQEEQGYGHGLETIFSLREIPLDKGIYLTRTVLDFGRTDLDKERLIRLRDGPFDLFQLSQL